MGQKWDKFLLLMWKNWVLQYRRPIQTVVEIVAPIVFSILLVVLRSVVDPVENDPVVYPSFYPHLGINLSQVCEASELKYTYGGIFNIPNQEDIEESNFTELKNITILYSPNNSIIEHVMRPFHLIFQELNLRSFQNMNEMEAHYTLSNSTDIFACIQFDDDLIKREDLGDNVNVAIRFPGELRSEDNFLLQNNWMTNFIFPLFQSAGPRYPKNFTGASPSYYNEGFLTIQNLLGIFITLNQACYYNSTISPDFCSENMFLSILCNNTLPLIYMRRFPYAAWIDDVLLQPLQSFVSMIFLMSFVYTCINTVKAITTEKEKQLKESMKIMGLPNWLHWTAWFLKSFAFIMTSIILMIILLKIKWYSNTEYTVLTHANPFVVLLFLFLYGCATITFCFAISAFFSKANTAATIAGFGYFVSYAPYSFMQNSYQSLSLSAKLSASLASNTAMAFGFQIILMYEGTGEGVQFDNIFKPNTPDDNLSLGLVMVMLFIDSLIYLLVALYVEAIFPGAYGVPQKWYFPFTLDFWRGKDVTPLVEKKVNQSIDRGEFFEDEPENLQIGIQVEDLGKTFNHKVAVQNLTINMYQNQITVLLGHNGAGKSTTMSMLTGMLTPTEGTASINGYDIRKDMESVRNSLGLCPQHNIIFDDLTVAEHLYFFSRLKGMRGKEIDMEITKYIDLLELEPKRNSKSGTLSGGMKRKLCVGVALCGKSKVVMLDEPTAGMDPSARRALWNLMLEQKIGRTILLTTHFMDEADLLGDRIAIMAGGKLKCCGSSFFLKKKYGAGYHLIIDKSHECDPNKITSLLRNYVSNIEVQSNAGSELTYLLNQNEAHIFEPMLDDLEQRSKNLGVNSYGISLTTLEEVFMKVGESYVNEETKTETANGFKTISYKSLLKLEGDPEPPLIPLSSTRFLLNQIKAMFLKRILSTWRSWSLLVLHIFLPVIFLVISMLVFKQLLISGNLPTMPLDLSSFDNVVSLVEGADLNQNYSELYHEVVGDSYMEVQSINETILNLTAVIPATVRRSYVAGASFSNNNTMTAYFNNDAYHTPGVALALALNVMCKAISSNKCNIQFSNFPMPYTAITRANQMEMGSSSGFQVSFNICFGMAFVSSFYILFMVRERSSKSKHLQFVSGVKVSVFWLVTFFWDFVTYIIIVCAVILALLCFQEDGFKTKEDIGRLFIIFIYFGWSMIPMMYISSYMFQVPSSGYTKMTFVNITTGCVAFLLIQILSTPDLGLVDIGNTLHWIFLIVPHYSLGTGIRDAYSVYFYNNECSSFFDNCKSQCNNCTQEDCFNFLPSVREYCENLDPNYYKWESPGIGRNILFSVIAGFIFLILVFMIEHKLFSNLKYRIQQKYFKRLHVEVQDEDQDVQMEKCVIRDTQQDVLLRQYNIVIKDLTKYYKSNLAVNGLCLGIKNSECFGLLGINGAGKTTTFKMLTGDVKISSGDAWVRGRSIKSQLKEMQKLIGYCPQFDALLDDLTARETLRMFALLRGIPESDCDKVSEKLAADFDYLEHLNKQVKELSGGNKRKLSTSIALIGDPPVIYLDEPTTGMDPETKRYLFNALCRVRDGGKTIILTSHSMEECEALCTRLAVMVNGIFKCLGSTQHLKSRFAEGYTLIIKVKKPKDSAADLHASTEEIKKFVCDNFQKSELREEYEEMLTYYVTDKSIPWSKMFGILEKGKQSDLNIEDYSLCQSSLEQVFLTFTRQQNHVNDEQSP